MTQGTNPQEAKREMRRSITDRIAEMTDDQRHAEGRTLSRQLISLIPEGTTLCGYFPIKTEADIRPLLLTCINRGDPVYLPRYEKKKMVFRKADKLTNLIPGTFTIPEPPIENDLLNIEDIDIILVPGRAFDKHGNRLGRGSGGFDTWLSKVRKKNPNVKLWGTCLECQLVHEVPIETHDIRMDSVVTARGKHDC